MTRSVPRSCPFCSAPLGNQTVSGRGFVKAHYACGTALGSFRQQVVPVRSEACRKGEARLKLTAAKE